MSKSGSVQLSSDRYRVDTFSASARSITVCGLGTTLLPRTAVRVETARSAQLLTGSFADPAPTRRIALAMRTGAARADEYEELASALRGSMRDLPVRTVA